MFGYVRVHKPEMKVKEYELYSAAYCGLCRSMGKCTGQCSRMALSYDFAFLALLRASLISDKLELGRGRCMAHPLRKKAYLKNNSALEYCSGAAALLNFHKLKDDLADEKGLKRLRALCLYPFMAYSRKRALKMGLYELDGRISEGLVALSALENEKRASVDAPARLFGEILGEIMGYGLAESEQRIFRSFGISVGKWIYIADALDDWAEDAKKNRYNPFILLYGKNAPSKEELEGIKIALKNELYSAEAAFDLMDIRDESIKSIISNIIYLGMPQRAETLAEDGKKRKNSKSPMGSL